MTPDTPADVTVTQDIPGEVWREVDAIAEPFGDTHRGKARCIDRLRRALAEQIVQNRASSQATPERLREALEELATLPDDLASLVAFHIRDMYPAVAKSAPATFLLSIRGTIRNKAHSVIQRSLAALTEGADHG